MLMDLQVGSSRVPAIVPALARLTVLGCTLFAFCGLGVLLEIRLFRAVRTEYSWANAIGSVSLADFSLSQDAHWAISCMAFRLNSTKSGVQYDVAVHDLRHSLAQRLYLSEFQPRAAAVAPTAGTVAIISSRDNSVRLWSGPVDLLLRRPPRTSEIRLLQGPSGCADTVRLVFSLNGKRLAAVGEAEICVFKLPSGRLERRLVHDSHQPRIALSADARQLTASGSEGDVSVWDLTSGRRTFYGRLTKERIATSALSPGGRFAALAETNGAVTIWDLRTKEELWRNSLDGISAALWYGVTFSAESSVVACAHQVRGKYFVSAYLVTTGEQLARLPSQQMPYGGVLAYDDRHLVTWDRNGLIRQWNLRTGNEQWRFSAYHWAVNNEPSTP